MGIACGGLWLGVAEQTTDNGKTLAEGNATGRESVAEIVYSYIRQISKFPDASPRLLHVCEVLAFDISRDHIGVVVLALYRLQQLDGD